MSDTNNNDAPVEETTTTVEKTEVTAPEPSTPAQDVVDKVHEEQQDAGTVVEETTTVTETRESD